MTKDFQLQTINDVPVEITPIPGINSLQLNYEASIGGANAPQPGADKTSENTAAGITNQGSLATKDNVSAEEILDRAITSVKIALEAISADVIAAGAITENKLFNQAVTKAKMALLSVDADIIAAGAVTESKIAANAVTAAKTNIAAISSVTGDLVTNSVGSTQIQDDAVISQKIVANAITAGKIAANAVTADKIEANAVTSDKIFANAITADKIASNVITAAKIAANTITAAQIAAGTITATEILSGTITAVKLATGAVTADKIEANAITSAKIAANTITASQIAANTITASQMNISQLSAISANIGTITSGTVTGVLLQTSSSANSGVKMSSDLGGIVVYGQTFQLRDTSNNLYGYIGGYSGYYNIATYNNRNMLLDAGSATVHFYSHAAPLNDGGKNLGYYNYRWGNCFTLNLTFENGYYLNKDGNALKLNGLNRLTMDGGTFRRVGFTFKDSTGANKYIEVLATADPV